MTTQLTVNGEIHEVNADNDTPLLYVLSDELQLTGPRFGCGLAQCGACSVLLDGVEIRSCVTPLSSVGQLPITTLEGLPAYHATQHNQEEKQLSPVQQAFIDEQAIQCGFCYNGMAIKASELLQNNPSPSRGEVIAAMDGHLCRCGTYPRIISAILKAADIGSTTQEEKA